MNASAAGRASEEGSQCGVGRTIHLGIARIFEAVDYTRCANTVERTCWRVAYTEGSSIVMFD